MPGGLRIRFHRALPEGRLVGYVFRKDAKGRHVCLQLRVARAARRTSERQVGVDVGISSLATLSAGP